MPLLMALMVCFMAEPVPTPVLLTTDFGVEVDDQWALTHLALSPRVDLRAVVTTHAPGLKSVDSAKAARTWLEHLPVSSRPEVLAGLPTPLDAQKTARANDGVERILSESRRERPEGRKLVVFVIGAATDMATALLTDPTLAQRVEVIAMGFSRWPEGGDPWNVKNDVHAWQVILDSDVPLVIGDETVCKADLAMTSARAHQILDNAGDAAQPLIELIDTHVKKQGDMIEKVTGRRDQWPIWDEVTVAHLLGLTRVETHPRPTLRDDLSFDQSRTHGTLKWVKSLDTEALWNDLAACFKARR